MRNCLIILFGVIIGCIIYLLINNKIELANFIVTAAAFGAAIYAIYYQHQESKQAEKNFKKQFDLQKEAALKQEIIGAWQVLANKAPGNSGKKEAIEFLASQGLPLCGIDMSSKTHGGLVHLAELFKDFKGDRSKIDLHSANFSGAILSGADFSGAVLYVGDFSDAILSGADFSGAFLGDAYFSCAVLAGADFSYADLSFANFNGAFLDRVNFSGVDLCNTKFTDCYISCEEKISVDTDSSFEFEIDERTDTNGEPIYPKNNPNYRYIKLKIK